MDLKAFREAKIAELESRDPQKLAYFKLGIDALMAGQAELAKLGMVVEVNDITPKPLTEAEMAAAAEPAAKPAKPMAVK